MIYHIAIFNILYTIYSYIDTIYTIDRYYR